MQVLLSTIFYKTSRLFNKTFLTWISLTCNIFSKKSWFLFSDKFQVQKSSDFINCFFWTVKRKIQKQPNSQLKACPPFKSYLFLIVWCVCVCVCVCVLFIYTVFIRVIFVSQIGLSLIVSNVIYILLLHLTNLKTKKHWKVKF